MFLIEPKIVEESDVHFSVIKVSRLRRVLVFAVAIVLNAVWLSPGFIGISIILLPLVSFLSVRAWNKVTVRILRDYILRNFKSYRINRSQEGFVPKRKLIFRLIESLLGLSVSPDRRYYVETRIIDLDLTKFKKEVTPRMIDLISACLGVVSVIGLVLRNTLFIRGFSSGSDLEFFSFLLIVSLIFSPMLVSWLIPVIWAIKDTRIKTINEDNHIDDYFEFIRKGFLSRFLGYAGFLGGLSLSADVINQIYLLRGGDPANFGGSYTLVLYALSVPVLVIAFFSVAGTAYFVGLLYLYTSHEIIVNDLRKHLSEYIPFGITTVRIANDEEMKFIHNYTSKKIEEYHHEIEDEEGGMHDLAASTSFSDDIDEKREENY